MNFGDKLISLRKKLKMTQEEVADKLDITRQTVSNWELNQTKPDLEQLKGLSKLYNISIDELIDNNIKEILTAKVSNTEKLAGLIYKILIFLGILMVMGILLTILGLALFGVTDVKTEGAVVTLYCVLDDKTYGLDITFDENNVITGISGDGELINELELENYQYQYEAVEAIDNYFDNHNGSCN